MQFRVQNDHLRVAKMLSHCGHCRRMPPASYLCRGKPLQDAARKTPSACRGPAESTFFALCKAKILDIAFCIVYNILVSVCHWNLDAHESFIIFRREKTNYENDFTA